MLQIGNGGTTGSILGNVTDNAVLAFDRSDSTSFGGNISGSGVLQHNGTGTLTLSGLNSYGGGTFLDAGTLAVSSDANLGAANGGLTFNGGTLQLLAGFTSNRDVTLNVGGIVDTNGNNATWAGAVAGAGGLTKTGAGMLTLSGAGTYLRTDLRQCRYAAGRHRQCVRPGQRLHGRPWSGARPQQLQSNHWLACRRRQCDTGLRDREHRQ